VDEEQWRRGPDERRTEGIGGQRRETRRNRNVNGRAVGSSRRPAGRAKRGGAGGLEGVVGARGGRRRVGAAARGERHPNLVVGWRGLRCGSSAGGACGYRSGIGRSFSGWPSSGRSALRTSWRDSAAAGRWVTAASGTRRPRPADARASSTPARRCHDHGGLRRPAYRMRRRRGSGERRDLRPVRATAATCRQSPSVSAVAARGCSQRRAVAFGQRRTARRSPRASAIAG